MASFVCIVQPCVQSLKTVWSAGRSVAQSCGLCVVGMVKKIIWPSTIQLVMQSVL